MPSPKSFLKFVCLIMLCLVSQIGYSADKQDVSLTILYTNDVHGHIFPFDYDSLGEKKQNVGGAARRAALIRNLKASAGDSVIVMDAGDVFTRGPLENLKGVPDFEIMNAVPYDVMTLGNNEFEGSPHNEAEQILYSRIKDAHFPLLSANVFDKRTGRNIVLPYKIFNVDGIKIGIFGLTTPRVGEYKWLKNIELKDPVSEAKNIVSELYGKADFIIALTHLGCLNDLELAKKVPQIDVIIGGDSHTWLFEPLLLKTSNKKLPSWWAGGTIICQDGEYGKCVGKLDLSLRFAPGDRYHVCKYDGKLVDVNSSVAPAPDIEKIIEKYSKYADKSVCQ